MFRKATMVLAGVLLTGSVALADTSERTNLQIYKDVSKAVDHYALFTIFDNVDIGVKNGVVTLTGDVTMPFKRDDIEQRVGKIDGVRQVQNNIKVLPASIYDDQLRYRIARSFFTNPYLVNYERGVTPSIHIVVDRGHVRLTGVVNSAADRRLASLVANQFPAFSVTNDLKTEAEVRRSLEQLD